MAVRALRCARATADRGRHTGSIDVGIVWVLLHSVCSSRPAVSQRRHKRLLPRGAPMAVVSRAARRSIVSALLTPFEPPASDLSRNPHCPYAFAISVRLPRSRAPHQVRSRARRHGHPTVFQSLGTPNVVAELVIANQLLDANRDPEQFGTALIGLMHGAGDAVRDQCPIRCCP